MYIYSSKEIKAADAEAADKGMTLFALMENAGAALYREIAQLVQKSDSIVILSGKGNNGGDGIVLARYLKNNGYRASLVFPLGEPQTAVANEHYTYFQKCGYEAEPFSEKMQPDWIVDGLLGVGSQLPLRSDLVNITTWINQQQKKVIAIDLPTGAASDDGNVDENTVEADYTFSLHGYKPSAFLFPSSKYYGEILSLDIGIPQNSGWRVWTEQDVRRTMPKRSGNTHKGSFGTALLIAGCDEMPGSAALSAIGALRFGTGKLSIATTKHASTVIGPLAPEATFQFNFSISGMNPSYSAVAIGPGLAPDEKLEKMIEGLLQLPVPVILDAGALSARKYQQRTQSIIITPHPGEFSRLTGKTSKEIQTNRIQLASEYAKENGIIVILKGKFTVTAFPDGSGFINLTGNSALSKGGTGDTLTGMLLAAAGTYERIEDAAANAVYIHGACADEWVEQNGDQTMAAHDFSVLLPRVCKEYVNE
ncbi:NAD(P)H-hydrate dehydratase [Bacillus benzoevorans]|uniref:Bifunctional NAD(P)H-hydrate repair enzyme n=1 Tax=Bacillus benzoevorans TaxID=1456 RepID=A0A7X0LVV1_9BACI|nr:NAD(P)H-hydrate dehydratase [Bacillus benzoevorans]MBB6446411.1 NAD(P)H-hydrate epimerase [Bacillus benzoevorans]